MTYVERKIPLALKTSREETTRGKTD